MAAFDYRQAEEIRDALARHQVRYLFIGKSGAILLGFPDTTQDAAFSSTAHPKTAGPLRRRSDSSALPSRPSRPRTSNRERTAFN